MDKFDENTVKPDHAGRFGDKQQSDAEVALERPDMAAFARELGRKDHIAWLANPAHVPLTVTERANEMVPVASGGAPVAVASNIVVPATPEQTLAIFVARRRAELERVHCEVSILARAEARYDEWMSDASHGFWLVPIEGDDTYRTAGVEMNDDQMFLAFVERAKAAANVPKDGDGKYLR
jgi:hypothetical protein